MQVAGVCRAAVQGWVIAVSLTSTVGVAQVSAPTDTDRQTVPLPFRPEDQKNGAVTSFAARGTPAGYTPNLDVRDFTGSYVSDSGAPPAGPGAGPPPGAAPPVGPRSNAQSCIPSFDSGAYATHLISSPGRLTVVGEENHRIRRIYIDGRHPANVRASYSGDSIGQWQGNTLVVDTIAIRGTDGLHLVERWTRLANGSIEIVTTRDGAGAGTQAPQTSTLVWRPDLSFLENICEDFGEAFGAGYGAPQN